MRPARICGVRIGKNLDSHFPLQRRVPRPVYFAHSAGADETDNLVWSEPRAFSERNVIRHSGLETILDAITQGEQRSNFAL